MKVENSKNKRKSYKVELHTCPAEVELCANSAEKLKLYFSCPNSSSFEPSRLWLQQTTECVPEVGNSVMDMLEEELFSTNLCSAFYLFYWTTALCAIFATLKIR